MTSGTGWKLHLCESRTYCLSRSQFKNDERGEPNDEPASRPIVHREMFHYKTRPHLFAVGWVTHAVDVNKSMAEANVVIKRFMGRPPCL